MMHPTEMERLVNDVVARCDERQHGSRAGTLANLSKRIEAATDKGLASAVYWRRWMTYGEAVQCQTLLAKRIATI